MSKQNVHQEAKKRRSNLSVAITGHNHRIKEQKAIIKEAKKAIKMHKLMKKQSRTAFKLGELELSK